MIAGADPMGFPQLLGLSTPSTGISLRSLLTHRDL